MPGLGPGSSPQQMQDYTSQLLNNPMLQGLMNNPELLRSVLTSNPVVSQVRACFAARQHQSPSLPAPAGGLRRVCSWAVVVKPAPMRACQLAMYGLLQIIADLYHSGILCS